MPPTAAEDAADGYRQPAPVRTAEFRNSRPQLVGPDIPEAPFPISLAGPVQKGFGRGGKDLGCPTANLPDESITTMSAVAKTGVYYGYAQVVLPKERVEDGTFTKQDVQVHPMVMSLGWNPFYKNQKLTAEIHVMHKYKSDFYGYEMRAVVLGYIRPELDYTSKEALIEDIETDKRVAMRSLNRPEYQKHARSLYFEVTRGAAL